ncbi:hypothetical protein Y1Q_0002657 [Alligator mississippiensis]|uniref:Uncharacterized protein n=1 Tax=Alligator mississippiensis TaxID=8496 RepID=A0A151NZ40_ALLMI|nr:hypothetical protein Y1Q_0002657 [Alligator mississippiensis]
MVWQPWPLQSLREVPGSCNSSRIVSAFWAFNMYTVAKDCSTTTRGHKDNRIEDIETAKADQADRQCRLSSALVQQQGLSQLSQKWIIAGPST